MWEWIEAYYSRIDLAVAFHVACICVSWVLLCHGTRPDRGWKVFLGELAGLLGAMFFSHFLTVILCQSMFITVWSLVHGLVAALYLWLRSPYHRGVTMLMWCCMYAGVCGISSIAGQVSYLTGDFLASGAPEGIARCLVYLLMIGLALYLRHFNFDHYRTVPQSGMALILVGNAIILIMTVVETLMLLSLDYHGNIILATAYLCLFVMELVAVFTTHSMCQEQETILELQTEQQRLQAERELATMTDRNLEDLRCIRHDLKNQYAYMQILLEQERYDELKDYFRQRSAELPDQLYAIDCGNRAMNTILNMLLAKAKQAGVRMEHQLVVPPVLPFADDDLCAILANLMDNALEECVRLKALGVPDPAMTIEIYPKRSYLVIVCRNSTDRKEIHRWGRGIRTTKADPQLHGYGTRIVTKLSEKYNGATEYTLDQGQFTALVMLDMLYKEDGVCS